MEGCHSDFSLQCRHIFAERIPVTFLGYMWLPSLILKAEEGWGEEKISTKGVVDRRAGGEGGGPFLFPYPPPPGPLLLKSNMKAQQTIASSYNANLCIAGFCNMFVFFTAGGQFLCWL